MIRSALILSATLLAAVCFACVLPPPAPGAVHGLTTTACSSANTPAENAAAFANKAANGYLTSPAAIYPGAPLPVSSALPQPGSGTPDYSQGLMNAFLAASTAFRQTLCTLDAVYVSAVQCTNQPCFEQSWGWWQSKPNTPNGRIVALSTGLWNEASYSSYETDLTRSLLPSNVVVNYSNASYCSSPTVCNSIDTPTIALLAALAHEVGHIAWYFQVPSSSPTSFCGGNFFTGWVASTVTPPPQWRDLLSAAARDQISSNGNGKWPYVHQPHSPQIDSIDHPGPGDQAAGKSVYALLYNGTPPSYPQPWASFFAALSPDEDFVETYKFAVLTTAAVPLNSVAIAVQGYGTANIAQDYSAGNRPDLTTKVGCVSISF
jgi:hypothetical protein